MTLWKIPFIFLDALWMRITATPPNPALPKKEQIIPDWRERFLKSLARPSMLLRSMYWSAGVIETLVIVASINPKGPMSSFILGTFLKDPKDRPLIRITAPFVAGNMLTLLGTLLRVHCYRTLGKLFTFELTILKEHALIVDGPYAFVRHPSYAGMILTIIGAYVNNVSGSWVRESGFMDTSLGMIMIYTWLIIATAVVVSLFLRIPREEALLRNRFGEEWDQWADNVPYKLLPGIY